MQRQLFDRLRKAIGDGTLKEGQRLPATRELAAELGVSRNCVINAFRFLAAQGLISARAGAGTRVAGRAIERQRVPPAWTARRGRPARIARIAIESSSGTAGAFRPGVPALDLFPFRTWRALVNKRWRDAAPSILAYGDASGSLPLREVIAAHLGSTRGIHCDAGQIVIVNGAQQAVDVAARVLLDPTDVVCVEDPGYIVARSALAMTGATVIGIPVDEDGFDVAAARKLAREPRVIYVTPSHQYPTGAAMSLARRQALLDWCVETGAWLIEDDYDGNLRRDGRELPAIHALARNPATIYVGSFSHLLAPVLRIGYAVLPFELVEAFRVVLAAAGRGPSLIEQAALAEFIANGQFARHMRRLRDAYAERQEAVSTALRALPGVVSVRGEGAGAHVVVHLRRTADEARLAKAAAAAGVEIPLVRAHGNGDGLMIGYGSTNLLAIRQGMAVVSAVAKRLGLR
jgi:GntR family transcriptional regulator/MocR family aminotransferase